MMSVPGLALFYGGLVRTKNMLSVLTQVLMIVCMVAAWSGSAGAIRMAFTGGNASSSAASPRLFLKGVDANALAATFSNGVYIPELTYRLLPDDLRVHHAGADRRQRSPSG